MFIIFFLQWAYNVHYFLFAVVLQCSLFSFCSGPTMFMVLSREDAVHGWREAIGPTDPELAKAEAPES